MITFHYNFHKMLRQRGGKLEDTIEHVSDKCHVVTLMVSLVGH